jgi:hypothetical protein
LFISTPLLAALIVVIKCLYVEDTLEKKDSASKKDLTFI